MLDGETEAGESCFGGLSKGERCRGAAGECLYLLRSSETVKFMPSPFQMRHCRLFGRRLNLIVWFMPIATAMMYRISVSLNNWHQSQYSFCRQAKRHLRKSKWHT